MFDTEALAAAAGPGLAALLAGMIPEQVDSDHALLELVAAWERLTAWAAAGQLAAIAEFARRPYAPGPPDQPAPSAGPRGLLHREHAADELAARLTCSSVTAGHRLALALQLAQLPATTAALADGRLDLPRARLIADATSPLAPAQAAAVEAAVLDRAQQLPPARLRPLVDRAVLAADPAAAERRRRVARDDRHVALRLRPDGMAGIWAELPAEQAVAIDVALDAAARALKARARVDDARTLAQLRADAFTAPFLAALHTGTLPGLAPIPLARRPDGTRPHIQLTVAALTLAGVDDQPGHLHRYGPITAAAARALAADGLWRRLLVDPLDGHLVAVDPNSYRPGAALTRHINARDENCRFPGCGRPADTCDLDHTEPHPDGTTAADNLGPLCRRHHRLKHHPCVHLHQPKPGTFHWTLPTGHSYTVRPPALAPPIPPARTPDDSLPPACEPHEPSEAAEPPAWPAELSTPDLMTLSEAELQQLLGNHDRYATGSALA